MTIKKDNHIFFIIHIYIYMYINVIIDFVIDFEILKGSLNSILCLRKNVFKMFFKKGLYYYKN